MQHFSAQSISGTQVSQKPAFLVMASLPILLMARPLLNSLLSSAWYSSYNAPFSPTPLVSTTSSLSPFLRISPCLHSYLPSLHSGSPSSQCVMVQDVPLHRRRTTLCSLFCLYYWSIPPPPQQGSNDCGSVRGREINHS